MTIESSFIPFPSEVVVPPAAYLAAQGELSGWGVMLAATLGAGLGACINYYLARYLGRPVVHALVRSRWGKFLLLSEEKLLRAEHYFDKKGAVSTFVGRLIPGIRQLISIPAGLSKMNLASFILYTVLGAGLWNVVLFALGYYAASIPGIETKEQLIAWVSLNSHIIGLSITAIVLVALVLTFWKRRRRRRDTGSR